MARKKKKDTFKIIEEKVKFATTFKVAVEDLNFALRKGFSDDHIMNSSEDVCAFYRAVKKELNSKQKLRKVM